MGGDVNGEFSMCQYSKERCQCVNMSMWGVNVSICQGEVSMCQYDKVSCQYVNGELSMSQYSNVGC